MTVVYRKVSRWKCILLDDYCIATPRPNCRNGCVVYKTWQESKMMARDYAHQRTVEEFPPADTVEGPPNEEAR